MAIQSIDETSLTTKELVRLLTEDAGLSALDIRSACDIPSEVTWQMFRMWSLTVSDCEHQGFYDEFVALYELCEEHGVLNERIRN